MTIKKPSISIAIASIASILIGLLITRGFLAEFTIMFQFDMVALIRIASLLAFFVIGVSLWQCRGWSRIAFLVLMGLNAILSLSGLYFFSFPLTIIPGPESQRAYLQNSLLMAWLPFLVGLYFLTRPAASARFRENKWKK